MNPIDDINQSKRESRGWSDEMTSDAIHYRLRIVADLYRTWTILQTARRVSDACDPTTGSVSHRPIGEFDLG